MLPASFVMLVRGYRRFVRVLPHELAGCACKIIEWFGSGGTPKIILFQHPCHGQGHLPLGQIAQVLIQPGLESPTGSGNPQLPQAACSAPSLFLIPSLNLSSSTLKPSPLVLGHSGSLSRQSLLTTTGIQGTHNPPVRLHQGRFRRHTHTTLLSMLLT